MLGSVVGFVHIQSLQLELPNQPGVRLIPSSFGLLPRAQVGTRTSIFFCRVGSIHAASFKFGNTRKYKMRSVRGQTSLERSAFSLPPHMNEPILTVAAERTSQLLPYHRFVCKPTTYRFFSMMDRWQSVILNGQFIRRNTREREG